MRTCVTAPVPKQCFRFHLFIVITGVCVCTFSEWNGRVCRRSQAQQNHRHDSNALANLCNYLSMEIRASVKNNAWPILIWRRCSRTALLAVASHMNTGYCALVSVRARVCGRKLHRKFRGARITFAYVFEPLIITINAIIALSNINTHAKWNDSSNRYTTCATR